MTFRQVSTLAILTISILISATLYLFRNQDADLTLHFYDHFGKELDQTLRGKVVWITGASSGIGEQLAYDFVKKGAKVVLSARRIKELNRVREKCIDLAKKNDVKGFDASDLYVLPLDIERYDTHKALTSQVIERFQKIDILVNNAGLLQMAWAKDVPLELDQRIMAINFMGSISLTKAVLPYMIRNKGGHFVVVNSNSGKYGIPLFAAYGASKFALKGYFDALRLELQNHNIDVTNLMIGPVTTNIWNSSMTSVKNKTFHELYKMPKETENTTMMPVQRCSHLVITSVVNQLDETWICKHPLLLSYYLSQYAPSIFFRLARFDIYDLVVTFARDAGMPPP